MGGQARQQAPVLRPSRPDMAGSAAGGNAQARFGNSFLAERLAARATESPEAGPSVQNPAVQNPAVQNPAADLAEIQSGGALKVADPLPVQKGEQRRTVCGVQIIGTDVSPSALAACANFVRMTVGNRKDIQERLQRANVALVIVPRDKKMTDVAQFAGMKGGKTFDGRVWDDVRGSGGTKVGGGLWAIAVPEENLVEAAGVKDGYGTGYSVGLHEFAHTVHSKGVSADERKRIAELYAARKKANGPWTESYGASNEREYFAQCTNCFFGQNKDVGQNSPDWLRDNDRPMYDFLVSIYGPPPRAQANA